MPCCKSPTKSISSSRVQHQRGTQSRRLQRTRRHFISDHSFGHFHFSTRSPGVEPFVLLAEAVGAITTLCKPAWFILVVQRTVPYNLVKSVRIHQVHASQSSPSESIKSGVYWFKLSQFSSEQVQSNLIHSRPLSPALYPTNGAPEASQRRERRLPKPGPWSDSSTVQTTAYLYKSVLSIS